ncbi:Ldh family oxidoreductase, partial [Rhizobium ruizarguesonis]
DMIGHDTHGFSLLNWYVEALEDCSLAKSVSYEVVNDRGAAFVWDGKSLPGAWLLTKAIEQACERVGYHGVVTAGKPLPQQLDDQSEPKTLVPLQL